jgi:hypothetical protein
MAKKQPMEIKSDSKLQIRRFEYNPTVDENVYNNHPSEKQSPD